MNANFCSPLLFFNANQLLFLVWNGREQGWVFAQADRRVPTAGKAVRSTEA
jgi:hypothetical protein